MTPETKILAMAIVLHLSSIKVHLKLASFRLPPKVSSTRLVSMNPFFLLAVIAHKIPCSIGRHMQVLDSIPKNKPVYCVSTVPYHRLEFLELFRIQ